MSGKQVAGGGYTIIVLAYQDSPYLERCLMSLVNQSLEPDKLLCCTSTPSEFIERICERHGVRLAINLNGGSIAHDWNFALEQVPDGWVTLAHQDDIYLSNYVDRMWEAISANPEAAMVIPWFREYADGRVRAMNLTHWVKHIIFSYAFYGKNVLTIPKEKLRLLSVGNPVPCGGVALNRVKNKASFDVRLQFTLDWRMWLDLAKAEGSFVYVRDALIYRRIHKASATSENMETGRRSVEEMQIFRSLWSTWVSNVLAYVYRLSYTSNKTKI